MEKNEHLTYFKVKNFKRFEEFELNDITQFNIIVGDNNVGKTTLLEALLFSEDIDVYISNLIYSFLFKFSEGFPKKEKTLNDAIEHILPLFFNEKEKTEHIFEITNIDAKKTGLKFEMKPFNSFSEKEKKQLIRFVKQEKGIFFVISKNNKFIDVIYEEDITTSKSDYFSYIPFSLGYEDDLTDFYSKHIQQNKETKKKFTESLKNFIPDIESVEISTRFMQHPVIEIFEEHSNEPKLLSTYGDGANKLFRILAEIIVSSGKRLMIDEIDTGIHYSRFEEFWKTILKTAKEYDVQLYATTHNPDCLNYLVDALENEDMQSFQKDTSVFALEELPDKSVKSFKHDFKGFSFLVKKGIEIRGGKNE